MTLPRFTIDAELSREGLIAVRDAIDRLLTAGDVETTNPFIARDRQQNADRKVGEVWGRVGKSIQRLLATAALYPPGTEFSMDDLARDMNADVKSVRSWHRNLGRSLRQVDEAIPDPALMEGRWDGTRNQYRMPPEVRQAIQARNTPPSG